MNIVKFVSNDPPNIFQVCKPSSSNIKKLNVNVGHSFVQTELVLDVFPPASSLFTENQEHLDFIEETYAKKGPAPTQCQRSVIAWSTV